MNNYLQFTVIAAIVTTSGTLLGLIIKDFLFVRYFDALKEKQTLERVSKKYKDPILLTAHELATRVDEMIEYKDNLSIFFTSNMLFSNIERMESLYSDDPYFIKYKLISTIYRFCAFFGWLELYRQDITFLNTSSSTKNEKLVSILKDIRIAVADGNIIDEPDWEEWRDELIFREELRAIGEGMIELANNQRMIIGYSKFQAILESFEETKKPNWIRPVIYFFTDFSSEKDFRYKRLVLLRLALLKLTECLDENYYRTHVSIKQTSN